MPGPAPKRSEQRRRRNVVKVDEAPSKVTKRGPEPPDDLSGLALRWFESLRVSGQSVYYAPSDWSSALIVAKAIEAFERKPSATLLSAILSSFGSLAVTEGDRRRLRIELERADVKETTKDVSEFGEFRARLRPSG